MSKQNHAYKLINTFSGVYGVSKTMRAFAPLKRFGAQARSGWKAFIACPGCCVGVLEVGRRNTIISANHVSAP